MKYILPILLLFSLPVMSQHAYVCSPYELALDSIAKDNIRFKTLSVVKKDHMLKLRLTKWFKLTLKPKSNISRAMLENLLNTNFSDAALNDLNASDVLNLASYDVRCKLYITPRMSLVTRLLTAGSKVSSYNYTLSYQYIF